jgi:hypothetical protein
MALAAAPAASAEWVRFSADGPANAEYHYDAQSLDRSGPLRIVRWHSGDAYKDGIARVWVHQIDCVQQTAQALDEEVFDARSGRFLVARSLRSEPGNRVAQAYAPGSIMNYLARSVC